jgi:hypothetical protein
MAQSARDAGFGEAAEFDGVLSGDGERKRFGVGQADVFAQRPDRLKSKVIVGLVRADPEPVEFAVALSGEGAVAPTNFGGVNAAFFLQA